MKNFKPLEFTYNAEQEIVFNPPKDIALENMFLEKVRYAGILYDSALECGDDVVIDAAEIHIEFASGGEMHLKTTDSKVLNAFDFDWQAAYDAVPEDDKPSWSAYKEHNTHWGL